MGRVCESESIHLPSVYLSIYHAVSNIRSDAGEWGGVEGGGGVRGVAMARHRLRILVLINQDYKNN